MKVLIKSIECSHPLTISQLQDVISEVVRIFNSGSYQLQSDIMWNYIETNDDEVKLSAYYNGELMFCKIICELISEAPTVIHTIKDKNGEDLYITDYEVDKIRKALSSPLINYTGLAEKMKCNRILFTRFTDEDYVLSDKSFETIYYAYHAIRSEMRKLKGFGQIMEFLSKPYIKPYPVFSDRIYGLFKKENQDYIINWFKEEIQKDIWN